MIRIISGNYRGKRIRAPKNLPVRPTTDRAKESLFNILNNNFYFDEIKALDLFAGTGNISYELASRGCKDITAIDENARCVRFIQETAGTLKAEGLQVHRAEVLQYLSREYRKFDLIFADPPYDYEDYEKLVDQVFMNNLLNEEGLMVVEHQSATNLETLQHFEVVRVYGNAAFSFFSLREEKE